MSHNILTLKKERSLGSHASKTGGIAFTEWMQREGLAEQSRCTYLNNIHYFRKWFETTNGEEMEPEKITHIDLSEYRQHMIMTDCEASTINQRLSAIRKYLTWAEDIGLIEKQPCVPRQIKLMKTAPRALDRKEQLMLLRAVDRESNARDKAVIITLLETGLRVSELVSLKLANIEINERSGKVKVLGKGAKQREVPLNVEARKALTEYMQKKPVKDTGERIFRGQRGALTVRGVEYILEKYAYLSKIVDLGPHTLRHTFAVNLINRGVGIQMVATLLGHSNLNTTMIYTRPTFHDLEKAIETEKE